MFGAQGEHRLNVHVFIRAKSQMIRLNSVQNVKRFLLTGHIALGFACSNANLELCTGL